jgi:uncharacterized protein (DUF2062 family)
LKFSRQIRYYYLRFIRLRGEPHELALGLAFGVFTGMMPIMPFQTALGVTLALFFRGSKITAALGTWVSNPLNWYFIYHYSYKFGVAILGLKEQRAAYAAIITGIRSGGEFMAVAGKALEAGGAFVAAFLVGGLVLGTAFAVPSYFVSLRLFKSVRDWRKSRKRRKL